MEDDLHFMGNGRQPPFYGERKTTYILQEMEDDLNFKVKTENIFQSNGR
jgi:hypothetical protein